MYSKILTLFFLLVPFLLLPYQFDFTLKGEKFPLKILKGFFPSLFPEWKIEGEISPSITLQSKGEILRVKGEAKIHNLRISSEKKRLSIDAEKIMIKDIDIRREGKSCIMYFIIESPSCKISLIQIENLEISFRWDGKRVFLDYFKGEWGKGKIQIYGYFFTTASPTFDLSGKGRDVSLSQVFYTDRFEGKLNLDFKLRGKIKDPSTINGEATLEIREGELGKIPYLLDIFSLIFTGKPTRIALTSAEGEFDIRHGYAYTQNLRLWGKGVSVLAKGYIGWNRKVDLLISFYFTRELLRFTPLTEIVGLIIDNVGNALVRVRMTGTLNHPNYSILPLPVGEEIKDILEKLFNIK